MQIPITTIRQPVSERIVGISPKKATPLSVAHNTLNPDHTAVMVRRWYVRIATG